MQNKSFVQSQQGWDLPAGDPIIKQAQQRADEFFANPKAAGDPQIGINSMQVDSVGQIPDRVYAQQEVNAVADNKRAEELRTIQNQSMESLKPITDAVKNGMEQYGKQIPGAMPGMVTQQPKEGLNVHVNLSPIGDAQAATKGSKELKPGMVESLFAGFEEGVSHYTDQLIKPFATHVLGWSESELNQAVAERKDRLNKAKDANPITYTIGSVGADVSAFGVAATPLGKAGTVLGVVGKNVIAGAITGFAADPTKDYNPDQNNGLSGVSKNLIYRADNAVRAGVMSGAVAGGFAAFGKGLAWAAGVDKQAVDKLAMAEAVKMPVGLSDISSRPIVNSVGKEIANTIPLAGMKTLRGKQAGALEQSIRTFADNVAEGSKGNPETIANIIANRYKDVKATTDKLFNKVGELAKNSGHDAIDISTTGNFVSQLLGKTSSHTYTIKDSAGKVLDTISNADKATAYQSALKSQATRAAAIKAEMAAKGITDQAVINEKIASSFAPIGYETAEAAAAGTQSAVLKRVAETVKTLTAGKTTVDYNTARQLRTAIGRESKQASTAASLGSTTISPQEVDAIKTMYRTISSEIDNWAKTTSPEVGRAYTRAVGYFKAANATFKDNKQLMNAIEDRGALQKFANNLFNDATPAKLQRSMAYVKRDMGAVRSNLVSKALNTAIDRSKPDLPVDITKMLTELRKPGDDGVKMIWGKHYDSLVGVEKLLRHVQDNIKTSSAMPATMKAFITMSMIGGGAFAPGTTAMIGVPVYALARTMSSPKAAKLLAHWSRITPAATSAVKSNLMQQTGRVFGEVLGKVPAAEAANSQINNQ